MLRHLVFLCLLSHTLCLPTRSMRPQPGSRIVGGNPTTISKFPYTFSLQYLGAHVCGGAIITDRAAISAANCFFSTITKANQLYSSKLFDHFSLRVGSSDSNDGGYDLAMTDIVIQLYDPDTFDGDIAIAFIGGGFPFGETVTSIAIPPAEPKLPVGTPAVVTGWGALEEDGSFSTRLHEVTVPIVDKDACNAAYEGRITDRMLCAGYMEGGKDACIGDSGGPLVVNNTVYGLVSWGFGCARPGYPGVYTDVVAVRDHILFFLS